jgi:hypothetical protein
MESVTATQKSALWLGMIVGFGLDIPRYLHEKPAPPTSLHVHAAVFSGWMLLLTALVLLVLSDRVAWHRRLGVVCRGMGMPDGGDGAMGSDGIAGKNHEHAVREFAVSVGEPPGYCRISGTAVVGDCAAERPGCAPADDDPCDDLAGRSGIRAIFQSYVWPAEPHSVLLWFFYSFYGNVLLIALMAGWDWWRGRLVRSFVVGAAGLLAVEWVATLLYFWGPWKTVTHGWVEAWVKHFS